MLYEVITSRILDAVPITLELGLLGLLASIIIGVPMGVISAVTQDSPLDYFIRIFSLLGLSIPRITSYNVCYTKLLRYTVA